MKTGLGKIKINQEDGVKGFEMVNDLVLTKLREILRQGDTDKAIESARQALNRERNPGRRSALASFAAKILLERAEYTKALEYAEEAHEQARLADDYLSVCKAAISIGRIYFRTNRYLEAEQAWHEALSLVTIYGDTKLHGRVLLNLAILDQHHGNHLRALDILEKARTMLYVADDTEGLVTCYSRMVVSYMEQNRPEDAILSNVILRDIAEKTNNQKLMAQACFREGAVHLQFGEYKKAIERLETSKALFESLGDKENVVHVLCSMIIASLQIGRGKYAVKLLNDVTPLAEAVNTRRVTGVLKLVSAELAVFEGNPRRAIRFYDDSLKVFAEGEEEDNFRFFHSCLRRIADKNLPGFAGLIKRARGKYELLGLLKELKELDSFSESLKRAKPKHESVRARKQRRKG